jgi:hypothetical protein
MDTIPLIFMIVTELTITTITVYFFVRVLKAKKTND